MLYEVAVNSYNYCRENLCWTLRNLQQIIVECDQHCNIKHRGFGDCTGGALNPGIQKENFQQKELAVVVTVACILRNQGSVLAESMISKCLNVTSISLAFMGGSNNLISFIM